MKKISLILAVVMIAALLASCGGNGTPDTTTPAGTTAANVPDNTTEEVTTAEEITTAAEVDGKTKSEGVLTYAEYLAAEVDKPVVIEGFLQAKYEYSEQYGNTSLYLADDDGAYFVYRWVCTKEQYDAVSVGDKLKVEGIRTAWSGEDEIKEKTAVITVVGTDKKIYPAEDFTAKLDSEDLVKSQNKAALFTGVKIAAKKNADGQDVPFLYGAKGTGSEGGDIYFDIIAGEKTYTFVVESDFCSKDTDVYKAAQALKIGDTVDIEGFLYWYNGVNTQVTKITVK